MLKAIAEAPAEPHEGVGIWISGFFGSGKSSFAKNLGYVLANRQVLGKQASDLFKHQLKDSRLSDLIDFINTRIPTEVIMFDVSVDRATRKGTERIAEVMYSVLLRELGYAEDYDVAELEISLEADHRLEEFSNRFAARYGEWSVRRKMSGRFNEASAILPEMDPLTYPHADSWAKSLAGKSADITVRKLVERTFTLAATSAVRWKDYRMPSSSVTLRKGTSCKPRRRRTGTPSGAASIPSPEIDTRSYVR